MSFFRNLSASVKRSVGRNRLPFLPGFAQNAQPYIATVDVDYVQRVSVGVEAASAEHAAQLVRRAFDAGTLFNDSSSMPVLMHAFEPVRPDSPLQIASIEEIDEMPPADPSVDTMKCIGASQELLQFARMIGELCEEASVPQDQGASCIGIDIPLADVNRLHKLLDSLNNC